jgi:hypothetical protein
MKYSMKVMDALKTVLRSTIFRSVIRRLRLSSIKIGVNKFLIANEELK